MHHIESRYRSQLILSIFTITIFITSCSVFRPADRAYTEFVESFENLDTAPLIGRIIVIDPGHGGYAAGAVGLGGLTEKDINLRVASKLQELLEQAGAVVLPTRPDDRDLFVNKIDSLRGNDLDYRVRLSNESEADLFLSIHHNSLLPINRKYNATETYYKMEDSYSSLDAARLINRHLSINLQNPFSFLRPGNYYVIRANRRTAVLGEASYISNPRIEKLLKQDEKAEFEAKSYFLGILDYFSRGIPEIELLYPSADSSVNTALPDISLKVTDDGFGGGIDPEGLFLLLDGKKVQYTYSDEQITIRPFLPLYNGRHTISAVAKNMNGNHSLFFESYFYSDLPPENISINHSSTSIPPDNKTEMAVTVSVLDRYFNPVSDSTTVLMQINGMPEKRSITLNGKTIFYIKHDKAETINYSITSGLIDKKGVFDVGELENPLLTIKINNNRDIPGTINVNLENHMIQFPNRDGYTVFEDFEPGEQDIKISGNGFFPIFRNTQISDAQSKTFELDLERIFEGSLFGKSIMIDPEGGGLSYGALGPTGLRASDETWETAAFLHSMLENAGADARLSRNIGDDLTLHTRVRNANSAGSVLFVSVRYSGSENPKKDVTEVFAFPSSSNGKRFGRLVAASFGEAYGQVVDGPLESAEYVLQQTASPALIVNLGYVTNPETESELYSVRRNRQDAYGLFNAVLKYFSPDKVFPYSLSGVVKDRDGKLIENALLSLNEIIYLQSGQNGDFKFINLEEREYTLYISANGYQRKEIAFRPDISDSIEIILEDK